MTELDDHELLAEFMRSGSETAFTRLVARHVNLVYSTALRFAGNPDHAQEISQAVFIILARKAGKLSPSTVLSGWLYQVARFTALNFVKREIRRQCREQEAYMQTPSNESDIGNWKQIAPLLDEAMGQLSETDRNAVVLRFFENKTAAEISVLLKLTEAATHKRVTRALEKLRTFFAKRGVNSTTAILAGTIPANSVHAAPVGLAKTISAAAILKGAAVSGSTLLLTKEALRMMAYAKAKTMVIVGAGMLLAAGSITIAVEQIQRGIALNPDRWRGGNFNLQRLERLPPQVRVLPSTFSGPGRRGVRGSGKGGDRKIAGLGFEVPAIFAAAYGRNDARVMFNTETPTNRYDFICTLTANQGAALQGELRKKFGMVGKLEVKETDVLLLTVKKKAAGLRPSALPQNAPASFQGPGRGHLSGKNAALAILANDLEQRLGIPVLDQTGTENGRFDFELTWDQSAPMLNIAGLERALSNELGLELIPARKSTEMVVVDNAKP